MLQTVTVLECRTVKTLLSVNISYIVLYYAHLVSSCTGCTNPCTAGLLLTLNQSSASGWTSGGNGFTTYAYTWTAPDTSSTIHFQFYTSASSNYWDLDSVSVKDSSATEKITNGGFSSKASWSETCGIGSCASIENYGPGLTSNYWINCINSTNYYSVSQTFTSIPCMKYNISFAIARYKGSTAPAFAYAYIY